MPELNTYKIHKRFDAEQEASKTSGDRYFIDDFSSREPDIGMCDIDTMNVSTWSGDTRSFFIEQSPTVADGRITAAFNQEEQKNLISDLSEKEDPFTQADLLDIEDYQVQELILRFRTLPSSTYHERLVSRLFTLFNDAREEDPVSPGIAVGSLRNFYNFIQLHTNLKCPSLSLTPDNNIYASWRSEHNLVFSVHFLLTNGDVRFVILKPNDMHSKKQICHSGTATIDTLIEEVESSNVRDWILE
ncbi:MAG: hypothetical protein GY777_32340 [Candidatus Brocadiaceae bacterium]|nr:hypothetical protein [Candidatus Brocadiaceae bacterium]